MRNLLAALLILAPGLALAHSELRSSSPADGARLTGPPAEFLLRFNEAVQVTSLRLLDAAGQPLPLRRAGDAAPRREERATPEAPLPPGALRLEWRAISADGHPIRGTIRFTLERAP
ncbi:copper resistance protein CopC [Roseococcus sp. SDR]|uniref:copper resistance CopC family protein n=1 Tax=Roseococcus sp. SDR TaxID=2835532 RepID=UPI001BCBBD65|nr:copper resistance CopC family protein [Roseococcus sp. SDR]MBS7788672.1 copper resistance protein CopC [Roseococcus sp. SDR]MBV1843986.1 copper resistance protein CopC [Roseococcus sp. SDR]